MPDVKTLAKRSVALSVSTDIKKETIEVIPDEDMYIIGFQAAFTCFTGNDGAVVVARTGQWRVPASYTEEGGIHDTDGVMFMARPDVHTDDVSNRVIQTLMLPKGCYFKVEKGERIYIHYKHRAVSGTYDSAITVVIYYTTEPPS